MNNDNFQQILMFIITATILYFTGNYIINMQSIVTFLDGFVTIVFFLTSFSFIGITSILLSRLFKSVVNFKVIK